ncbi:MAG: sigma 54-interacting transcriptional regulator [Desulfobacterales bacterium]
MEKDILKKLEPGFADILLESIAEGVFTLNRQGQITFWNGSMERITGYSAEEAIGRTCAILNFNRCFGRVCPAGIHECGIFQHGRIDGKECLLRHKNGSDIPVLKNARVVKNMTGNVTGVVETITDLTELHKARRQADEANRRLGEKHKLHNIIGKSSLMKQVFSAISSAAASEATILIQGESGTGKELAAGAIHYNSSRSDKPFVTVNCCALSESLLESELFGHVKGAFTGAVRDRAGRFEEAAGGTLFLDEIGEISPFIQIKLLRVLQERVIERVGESTKRKIDIRIITAANKDLYHLVSNGTFREDLYYRLKVFPINLPPLRQRKEDVPLLISHFITSQNQKTGKQIKGVSQSAMRILMDFSWPGNIRELENAIEHAFVICEGEYIDMFDLPVEIRQFEYRPTSITLPVENMHTRRHQQDKLTRDYLLEVLALSNWNKAEASRRIGLSRASVWKYMKKWDIPMKQPS